MYELITQIIGFMYELITHMIDYTNNWIHV
jgi:hypothetical protein